MSNQVALLENVAAIAQTADEFEGSGHRAYSLRFSVAGPLAVFSLPWSPTPPAGNPICTSLAGSGAACNTTFFAAIGCGTTSLANNNLGDVVGTHTGDGLIQHGFLRDPDGVFVTIDAPGAGTRAQQGTLAFDANPSGRTAGTYIDAGNVNYDFVRTPPARSPRSTRPGPFSPRATTGVYGDAEGTRHGFERDARGHFANFSAPDAAAGPFLGTRPSTNNAWGEVTGWYIDANGVFHGFVWQP